MEEGVGFWMAGGGGERPGWDGVRGDSYLNIPKIQKTEPEVIVEVKVLLKSSIVI
jgi:hypothetical protein